MSDECIVFDPPEEVVKWFEENADKFDRTNIISPNDLRAVLERSKEKEKEEMRGNEYQELAMRTANEKCQNLSNTVLGLTGESGECADIVKKHLHHEHPFDREHFIKELGDVLWYVALGCTVVGVTMEEVMHLNIAKLRERYPEGFSAERSLHRAEGDV